MALRALHDLPAPAKLNLFLHVVGRRPDGYHLLQSVFALVDWADTLHFELRRDGVVERRDLGPALPADDLCLRAARLLREASGSGLGATISIAKEVPWGAGLGGGSSDAATTLLALNRLWGLRWPRARLMALGLRLGADVPFFVGGHNAFVEGIGERLRPVRLAPARYVVVKPSAPLATGEVFAHPALVRDTEPVILEGSLEEAGSVNLPAAWQAGFGRNDLQAAAEACCPEVAQAARSLRSHYGNSRMTGSGSAVFARVGADASSEATLPAALLAPGWEGRMCRSLAEHPLCEWAD